MTNNRANDLITRLGEPVAIRIGAVCVDTLAVALERGEFLVARGLSIQVDARFCWRDREYVIVKIEPSQLGDVLHTKSIQ